MSSNTGYANKLRRRFFNGNDCSLCRHYQGKRRGCKLDSCCREDEKLDAIAYERVKRKKGSAAWRG